MVCAECRCQFKYQSEPVKLVNEVAAIRQYIETLTTQEQLSRLGQSVKEKYEDIFSPIPHLDELPTDIYC
jgi:hypothetical protein